MFKFAAVILDMDGLVLDTEHTYRIAWQQAALAMGFDLSVEFCLSLTGSHRQEIEQKLLGYCGSEFNLQQFNQLSGNYWHDHVYTKGIDIKYGFSELLNLLISLKTPYCLATNSRQINTDECLELAGIKGIFPIIVTRDDVTYCKPEPDIFFKSAELLQVDITQCLVIEDSYTGIVAASKAGAIPVLIPSNDIIDQRALDLCHYRFTDLAQLASFIEQGCLS